MDVGFEGENLFFNIVIVVWVGGGAFHAAYVTVRGLCVLVLSYLDMASRDSNSRDHTLPTVPSHWPRNLCHG